MKIGRSFVEREYFKGRLRIIRNVRLKKIRYILHGVEKVEVW